jgi:hypothetical protein
MGYMELFLIKILYCKDWGGQGVTKDHPEPPRDIPLTLRTWHNGRVVFYKLVGFFMLRWGRGHLYLLTYAWVP